MAAENTAFVGLKNYKTLMNPIFYKALKNSALYMVLSCAIMIPIPMVLAAMLNNKNMVCKGFFRSAMFVPALTSVVVAGVVFRMMFGELEGSFANQVLSLEKIRLSGCVSLLQYGLYSYCCVCGDGRVLI